MTFDFNTAPPMQQEARTAAEGLVREEVVQERLGGDPRGFKRWASNNRSYFKYRVGLKAAELNGDVARVQAADEGIASRREAGEWRKNANGTVTAPTGMVMTLAKAVRNGYEG